MRVLILIESGPAGQVDVTVAADRDWRADSSKALPAQVLAQAAIVAIEQSTEGQVECDLCLQPAAKKRP
jgi:hypothetical protein